MQMCLYHDYYVNQVGSGVGSVYKGAYYQRGHGIGSFLKGLFRTIYPLVKSGVKTIGKEAAYGGINFLKDVIQHKPPKTSFKERFNESTQNLHDKAVNKINEMVGSGKSIKRKRSNKKNQKLLTGCRKNTQKRKKKSEDIFN